MVVKFTKTHSTGRVDFRRAFPPELLPFIPGKEELKWAEHKVSLGMKGSPGLFARHEVAGKAYDAIVAAARKRQAGAFDDLSRPTVAFLAESFRVELLRDDEDERWSPEPKALFNAVAADLRARGVCYTSSWTGHEGQRWAGKRRETLEWTLPKYRRMRAEGDLDAIVECWSEDATELTNANGMVVNPNDSDGLAHLCRALNDAAIAAGDDMVLRLEGHDVPTPPTPVQSTPARQLAHTKVPLLETFEAYADKQEISAGVRREWRRYIEKLIVFLGHDDASQITASNIRDWRDKLLIEPTSQGRRRAPVTVRDKYIVSLRAMLRYAVEEQLLKNNVASEVKVRVPKTPKLRDRTFTHDEAIAILSASLVPASPRMARGNILARRWVPWLCAYSGARVNEITQLRTFDVYRSEDVWVMRITPEAGTVKTQVARIVPIHEHVIAQGFLGELEKLRDGPIFYDPGTARIDRADHAPYKKVGEKIAEWVRKTVGITDKAIMPNHAWRHVFKSKSYDIKMEERMADMIQGHAPKTTGRVYGPPSITAKAEAMATFPRFMVPGT